MPAPGEPATQLRAEAHRAFNGRMGYVVRAPRVPVTIAVQHRGGEVAEVLRDDAEDISVTGLFVRCAEPYTVGTDLRLELALPGGAPVEARGRVVRVGPGATGHTGMGIMFVGLDAGARQRVEAVVAARAAPP